MQLNNTNLNTRMAVKKCCVESCKSCSTRKEDKGVTYHKFPKDATSRNEWLHITHFNNTHKDLVAYVCSRHFCKGDFEKNKDSKYTLKSDAVPSIFPWTIDSLKMDTSQIEKSLSSIINEDEKNLSSSSKGSDVENLDAIRKFIEEQEKEIQERESQEREIKNIKERESQEREIRANEERVSQERELKDNQEKESQEREITNIKQAETKSLSEHTVETADQNVAKKEDLKEHTHVASSILNMILSESEAKIAEKTATENAKDPPKESEASSKSEQKIMSPDKGNASMPLSVGCRVEVKDFGDDWYPAEIAEVDFDELEVLVQYEADYKKPDEWIDVSSPRLRPFTGNVRKPPADPPETEDPPKETIPKLQAPSATPKTPLSKENILPPEEIKEEPVDDVKLEEKPKVVFEIGERCLARWRDNRRFCATIQKDLGDGNFEIMFDDGFIWKCGMVRLHKMKADKSDSLSIDTSFQAATAGLPSPMDGAGPSTAPISPILPFHTHLFDPSRDYLGSKSERREKKRKLNIKEIFNIGQKKTKIQKTEKDQPHKPPVEKKPRVVKKNAPPRVRNVVKKEIQLEIPDAVASIIGTVTKEVEIKLEQIDTSAVIKMAQEAVPKVEDVEETTEDSQAADRKEQNEMEIDETEPFGVVNPDDETMDDEDLEEPKSESDPVLEEEVKLENFEQQDTQKHEEVLDKIKEAIFKLEGGISEIEKKDITEQKNREPIIDSPVEERATPKAEIEVLQTEEVKTEDLKDVLAEVAATLDTGDGPTETESVESSPVQVPNTVTSKVSKPKRDPMKIKKGKKLRLLQEKKVKRQVQKVQNELEQMKRQFEEMRKQMLAQTQEISKGTNFECAPLPESYLMPGEWACKWVNGQPVGKVSEVEGPITVGADNKPSIPRRSVEVEDKRLPAGWSKHMVRRSVGHSAGKWDVVLVGPAELDNRRFHTKTEMRNLLASRAEPALHAHAHALMDFGTHLKVARRMGWISSTPDGIAEAPETILPAGSEDVTSPLVKRRNLNLKKRMIMKERKRLDKKRRPIKIKLQKRLHTYNSQLVGESSGEALTETVDFEPPMQPLEDGYEYVGSLKVQIIDNLLRCPAEGCFKNFRTKTLLQMHIKHYHRELARMMGATPKVLDLAYARTMPNDNEPQQPDKKVIKVKINKPPKREEPRVPAESETPPGASSPPTPDFIEDIGPSLPKIPRSLDSPKLRQALIHKPVKRPRVLLPVRRAEPELPPSDGINDDVFEDQVTEPLIEVPMLEQPLDFETAISTHTVTKPLDIKKKKGDKKKSFASISKNISEDEEWFAMNSDELDTRSSFPRSGSPDSKVDSKTAPMSSESNDDQKDPNLYTMTESGERIKIVHMKREEIINCHCGFREEDGLMVQCELCLCWQHALCHNIQRECEVPEKYTCSICLSPRRGRRSQRFLHDQDRLYEGLVAGARPCDSLRRSHELAGNLLRVDDALHALRVKYYVATKKDHPKLYLWAADWEQAEITYTQEKLNSDYSDLSVMINGMDKENLPVKQEDAADGGAPPDDDHEADSLRSSRCEQQLSSQSLLSGLVSSPGGASLDLPISTSELERLAKSVQESAEWQRVTAPQPEAAIEDEACRARLLRHIQRCQALIDTRLDSIEAQVAELESQDPSFGEHYETAEFYPRTKQTIQMLMRDLDTMEELGVIT